MHSVTSDEHSYPLLFPTRSHPWKWPSRNSVNRLAGSVNRTRHESLCQRAIGWRDRRRIAR